MRLAHAVLIVAREDSNDADRLKNDALQVMALAYKKRNEGSFSATSCEFARSNEPLQLRSLAGAFSLRCSCSARHRRASPSRLIRGGPIRKGYPPTLQKLGPGKWSSIFSEQHVGTRPSQHHHLAAVIEKKRNKVGPQMTTCIRIPL